MLLSRGKHEFDGGLLCPTAPLTTGVELKGEKKTSRLSRPPVTLAVKAEYHVEKSRAEAVKNFTKGLAGCLGDHACQELPDTPEDGL